MKQALVLALLTIFSGSAHAANGSLAESFYPNDFDLAPAKTINQITKKELANKQSPLSKLVATLETENCDNACISIDTKAFAMVYSGKSGIQYFGQTYIVPVWANHQGSGLITEVLGHLVISIDTDMDQGTTVTITKFIPLSID